METSFQKYSYALPKLEDAEGRYTLTIGCYINTHAHTRTHTHAHPSPHTHAHTHPRTRTHTHSHTHTHTHQTSGSESRGQEETACMRIFRPTRPLQ